MDQPTLGTTFSLIPSSTTTLESSQEQEVHHIDIYNNDVRIYLGYLKDGFWVFSNHKYGLSYRNTF